MQTSVEASDTAVSVAIINHNGKHYLAETIHQVQKNCPGVAEVMVVDNLSTDGSLSFLRQTFPFVRIIAREANDGPGAARNLALLSADTDLVLLLDNDVSPCAGCLPSMIESLHRFPRAAVAMPAVLYHDRPDTVQFAGAYAHFMGTVAPYDGNSPAAQLEQASDYCTSMISAALLVDKRRLGEHGLFNESLFIYQEDHEAGYRCQAFGLGLLRVPSARCLHREGTAGLSIRQTGKVQPLRMRHTLFNRWYVLATLYQWQSLVRYLPALLGYEMIVLSGALIGGWTGDWLWAVRHLFSRAPAIIEQRCIVQGGRLISDADILQGGRFPFNTDIESSRMQKAGQQLVNLIGQMNWRLTKPRKMR